MQPLSLGRVPAIAAAPGRIASIGDDVQDRTGRPARVLLVADPVLAGLGITGQCHDALDRAGHEVVRFEAIVSDPSEADVVAGMEAARGADALVGIGGGSALDAAKMIATLVAADQPIEAYRLGGRPLPARSMPLICVPTTAGTGAEATAVSILSGPDHTKYWFHGAALKPDSVILDARLTTGLPPALTAATGLDALVHAMEAATNRSANPGSDIHAFAAIRLVLANLETAVARPANLEARHDMLLAATFAGIAIDTAGTALAHAIGHALGSLMPIHHGRAVAIAMEATLPWVIEGNPRGFDRVAEAFGLGPDTTLLPGAFAALLDRVGLDRSLPAPVDPADLAQRIAAPENAAMCAATARPALSSDFQSLACRVVEAAELDREYA